MRFQKKTHVSVVGLKSDIFLSHAMLRYGNKDTNAETYLEEHTCDTLNFRGLKIDKVVIDFTRYATKIFSRIVLPENIETTGEQKYHFLKNTAGLLSDIQELLGNR